MSSKDVLWEVVDKFGKVMTGENIQTYIFGTKKDGNPRAAYDILKPFLHPDKKKKKGKKGGYFSLYDDPEDIRLGKKKKKKKKKDKKKGKKNKGYHSPKFNRF